MAKNDYTKKLKINLIVGIVLLVVGLAMAISGFVGFYKSLSQPEESRKMGPVIFYFAIGFLGIPPVFIGMFKTGNNASALAKTKTDEKDRIVAEKDREVLQEQVLDVHYDSINNIDPSKEVTVIPNNGPVSGDAGPNNKAFSKVFNFFWIIFVGIWSAISNAIMGVALCVTIVGIPAGISCFKIIPLVFHPAGREVRLHYGDHKFWNTANIIFGGFEAYLIYNIYAFLLCVTIIGIPLGLQFFKIAKFYLAPYGSEVVLMNAYSEKRNHYIDLRIFYDELMEENKPVKLSDGSTVSALDAMKVILTSEEKQKIGVLTYSNQKTMVEFICGGIATMIYAAAIVFGLMTLVILLTTNSDNPVTMNDLVTIFYYVAGIGIALGAIISVVTGIAIHRPRAAEMKVFREKLVNISTYYPQQSKSYSQKLSERRRRGYKLSAVLLETLRGDSGIVTF